MKNREGERGFILNFTLLFVGVMLVIVVVTANATLAILNSAEKQTKSLQAYYAALGGIECVDYYQGLQVFDTTHTLGSYDCLPSGSSGNFSAGVNPPTAGYPDFECDESVSYPIHLEYSNGSCADVLVEVNSYTDTVPGIGGDDGVVEMCTIYVESTGKSSCSATNGVVEQVIYLKS